MSDRAAAQRPKKKRSRFGCNTCRARKVKCDERPNGCGNCEKLQLECSGYERPAPKPRARSGKRTYRSCNACRVSRSKCSGDRPICSSCQANGKRCSYADTPDRASSSSLHSPDQHELDEPTPTHSDDASHSNWRHSVSLSASGSAMDSHLPWINASQLPDQKHMRVLLNSYFQNFHPLRCFAFIHKPSFLQRTDDESNISPETRALLHIMCAIGAQFYALEYSDTVHELSQDYILMAGNKWAKKAQKMLLENTDKISTESLRTGQLLYDYALRMGNFTQAFMLSALMARMTQALQINLEYSTDVLCQSSDSSLSATTRECRRRLMWSCYVTDVICGSGVDQLTLIHEKDLKIQLPCNDWSFLHGRACITRTIRGPPLDFLPPEILPPDLDGNMGLLGFFVQHMEMRRRVLRYIKRLDTAKSPWEPDSEFASLDAELRSWFDSLPGNIEFTSSTIYMRKESSKIGALCLFHCSYHQTMCDLYRLGTPELYKLRSPFQYPPEKMQFLTELQWSLFKEARTIAAIIAEAGRHGPRTIGDSWLPTIAYDSNRIMLFYLTQLTEAVGDNKRELILSTIPFLQSNLKALKDMSCLNAVAIGLARAAEEMLNKLGIESNNIRPLPNVILDDPFLALFSKSRQSVPGTPPQSAPDYVLNPLSIFRMARSDIPEGHAPERASPARMSSSSSILQTPGSSTQIADFARGFPQHSSFATAAVADQSYASVEGVGSNIDMFFAPDLQLDWHTAGMAVGSGMEGDGLVPWVGATQFGEYAFEPQS